MSTLKQVIDKIDEICEAIDTEWFRYTRLKEYERLTRFDGKGTLDKK